MNLTHLRFSNVLGHILNIVGDALTSECHDCDSKKKKSAGGGTSVFWVYTSAAGTRDWYQCWYEHWCPIPDQSSMTKSLVPV